jgi:hypothetical protein
MGEKFLRLTQRSQKNTPSLQIYNIFSVYKNSSGDKAPQFGRDETIPYILNRTDENNLIRLHTATWKEIYCGQ